MGKEYYAEKKEASVLFCDIRNFTSLFESADPMLAVRFANTVLARLGEVVERFGGKVDRFTGDGFLAHFGIENNSDSHVFDACKAAIGMRDALKQINVQRYEDVQTVVAFGIGIHTGTVAYGEIKTKQINQKTVFGDVVNTASRIEQLTKYFTVDILVSEECYERVDGKFHLKKMPMRKIRGKKGKIQTYWMLPMNSLEE